MTLSLRRRCDKLSVKRVQRRCAHINKPAKVDNQFVVAVADCRLATTFSSHAGLVTLSAPSVRSTASALSHAQSSLILFARKPTNRTHQIAIFRAMVYRKTEPSERKRTPLPVLSVR